MFKLLIANLVNLEFHVKQKNTSKIGKAKIFSDINIERYFLSPASLTKINAQRNPLR